MRGWAAAQHHLVIEGDDHGILPALPYLALAYSDLRKTSIITPKSIVSVVVSHIYPITLPLELKEAIALSRTLATQMRCPTPW